MLWRDKRSEGLQGVWWEYWVTFPEVGLGESSIYLARYGSLQFLAWLLDVWPHSPGCGVAMQLLAPWLKGKPNRISRHLLRRWDDPWNAARHDMLPRIRDRLGNLYEAAILLKSYSTGWHSPNHRGNQVSDRPA